ncbi:MAG TPA: Ig-like domain-containing protein [Candidatus Angelobacter sp.]|nr:Ig-like domain-containing protein [Candidatus Angelobacter sp.]
MLVRLKFPVTFLLLLVGCLLTIPLFGQQQLDQTCVVSVLNRTVQVNSDGTWILPNIPAGFGLVRARATCVQNGITSFGQSDLFSIQANLMNAIPPIPLGGVTPIPIAITVQAPTATLTQAGANEQLTTTASFADGTLVDVTSSAAGTQYTISNPSIATISADGLVTAVSSGTVAIQAVNEGTAGIVNIQVVLAGASHGGIPDSWAIAHGLDPNDPAMPFEDPDHDGLTNLQEFQNGTDPNNPDTDGDGLTDGQEVLIYHTSPVLFSTDGTGIPDGIEVQTGTLGGTLAAKLAAALKSLEVKPSNFVLNVNTIQGLASQQLQVLGHLIDGKTTLDLTSTLEGTNYSSSDLTICNFGVPDGNVFAGSNGSCTITVANGAFSAQAAAIVRTFAPTALSFVSIPGFANGVDVNGNFAFVAAGGAGLQVVNVTDRSNPIIVGSLALSGNANDVKLLGNLAYVAAGSSGVHIIDITSPLAPVRLGTLSTGANALDIAVRGTRLYVANGSNLLLADVTNPASPTVISTLPLTGTIQGVDVDAERNLAVVSAGTNGIYVVDISTPNAPALRGTASTGDARDVAIRGNFAFVADFKNSTTSVDITSPSAPAVLSHIADPNLGGFLQDIVLSGEFALGADVKFVNGIPITDISDPTNLRARAILNFPQRDDNAMGIAADGSFVYLATEHNNVTKFGSFGDSRLYIGQYLALVDNKGIPPTASITSPITGSTVVEGSTLPITVNATDDVAVAAVNFLVNGQVAFTVTAPPYQFNLTVPTGNAILTLGATAVDLGNNVGTAQNVTLKVVPDPLTTATGTVVDQNNNAVNGATVTCLGFSGLSGVGGAFSISGLPTVKGNVRCNARFTAADGTTLSGDSASLPPVPGATTNVGTIVLRPGGRLIVAQRDSGQVQILKTNPLSVDSTLTLGSDVIDVAVSPDGSTAAVTSFSGQRVTFIDLTSQPPVVTGSVGTPIAAEAVAFTPDGRFVVVTDGGGSTIVVSIDVAAKSIVSTISLPVSAQGVAVTPTNTVLANAFNNAVVRTLTISSAGTLTDTGSVASGGSGPINVAVSPNGQLALVPNWSSNNVGILRIANGTVSAGGVVLAGFTEPQSISFLPNGTGAFVLSCFDQVASVSIDNTGTVTDTGARIAVGAVPCYFGVHQIVALPNSLQVAVHTGTGVILIDAATGTISSTITLPGNDGSVGGIAVTR